MAPTLSIHDAPPPIPSAGGPKIGTLGATAVPRPGSGEEPDLALLVPGKDQARGAGGGIAGRDRPAASAPGDAAGSIRRGGGSGGLAGGAEAGLTTEQAFAATGLASFLGRKYGVALMDASRIGSRTSDGAAYALLVPQLSEAYRAVPFRGRRNGDAADPVESVEVDKEAIAIRYRDGTVHVLVPTSDGLVALYVSSQGGTTGRSKVQEAARALGALLRFAGGGGQAG